MLVSDILTPGTVETITNKMVYAEMTSSFPPTKVVRESNRDYGNVWARLHSPVVEARARDIMYLMLHNKLPVVERLFRIRLRPDPYCKSCIGAEFGDVEHFFCLCQKTGTVWSWLKGQIVEFGGQQFNVADWELLNLFFPSSKFDKEVVWLISTYVMFVWENGYVRDAEVKQEQFFGFLSYKYREHQLLFKNWLQLNDVFNI